MKRIMQAAALVLLGGLAGNPALAETTVGWRGDGTGRFPSATPPAEWSKEKNVAWKVALPGASYGAPIVVGDNLFVETPASGAPTDTIPATEGVGDLQQGNLEQANVEAVTEISDLISAQRAYEMNAKVITAADQMLQSASNLMR